MKHSNLLWLPLLYFYHTTTSDQLWRQEESKGEEVFNYHGRRNPENSNVPSITVPSYFWNTFCIMGFVTTNPLKFPPFHYLIREDFLYIKFRGIEALLSHSRHLKYETKNTHSGNVSTWGTHFMYFHCVSCRLRGYSMLGPYVGEQQYAILLIGNFWSVTFLEQYGNGSLLVLNKQTLLNHDILRNVLVGVRK